MFEVIAIVVGLAAGFALSRALRRPTSTAGAASVARSAASTLGGRRGLSVPALQRSVLSEMYRHIGRGPGGRGAVPESFLIHLHPDDEASVREAPDFFRRGLIEAIVAESSRQGWQVPGHIQIETVADPRRHPGSPAVSRLDPGAPAPVAPAPPLGAPQVAPPVLNAMPAPTQAAGGPDMTAAMAVPGPEDQTTAMGPTGAVSAAMPPAYLERTDQPGSQYRLQSPRLVIGRSKTADIQVDDSRVSRAHLAIEMQGRRWTATDEGSSNGSWANGEQMPSGRPHLLRDGDRIQVGPVTFTFRQSAGAPPGPAADATQVINEDWTRR